MKLEVPKEKILSAVTAAARLTGRNPSLPVLSCVLLSAKENMLQIRSTNLELGVEIVIPVKVSSPGTVAVPGAVLANTLSLSNTSNLTLEESHGNLIISKSGSTTTIKALGADDFPTLPRPSAEVTLSVDARSIIAGLQAVLWSASVSLVKPELASVYIAERGGNMVFVATDSFRLAEKTIAPEKKISEFGPLLIPIRNIPEIIRTLELMEGAVAFEISENQIAFQGSDIFLTSRLLSGTFPDYMQIIPKESGSEAVVLKADLSSALKKMGVFSDKFNQVNFSLTPPKGIVVSASNQDVGEATETIAGKCTGEKLSINFNHRYIAECIPSVPGESVHLSFSGPGKPLLIKGAGDSSFRYLVMPMNK